MNPITKKVAVSTSPVLAPLAPSRLHQIVIVGGGAGGLELATTLGNKLGKKGLAEITLIDKTRSHIWKPKLHEIAAGSMDIGAHEVDFSGAGALASFLLPHRRDDRLGSRVAGSDGCGLCR